MVTLIDDEITTLTQAEAALALKEAWRRFYGYEPKTNSLSLLWAQSALETGRWKIIHCFNFGNIKKRHAHPKYKFITDDGHDYCMFRCSEVLHGKEEWFDPPHPQTHFRAYHTAIDGALDYLKLVANKERYKKAWSQVLKGDPVQYCAELKKAGYFTASLSLYTKGVVKLSDEFRNNYNDILNDNKNDDELSSIFSQEDINEINSLVGLTTSESVYEYFSRSDKFDDESERVYYKAEKPWWKRIV